MGATLQNDLAANGIPADVFAGRPADAAKALVGFRAADTAEALNSIDRTVAAQVLAAMPVEAAVQIFNEPHLDQPAKLISAIAPDGAVAILAGVPRSFASCPSRRAKPWRRASPSPSRRRCSSC
jgi:hypothetical protein